MSSPGLGFFLLHHVSPAPVCSGAAQLGHNGSGCSLPEQSVNSVDSLKSWLELLIQEDLENQETEESSRSQKAISVTASFNFSKNIYDVSLDAFKPPQNTAFTDDTHFSRSLRGTH